MAHLLLNSAFNYKKRKTIAPPVDFVYDKQKGAWLSKIDYSLLVNNSDFPQVGTKKFDVETGEDHKGE